MNCYSFGDEYSRDDDTALLFIVSLREV